jgi:hypothetical protein
MLQLRPSCEHCAKALPPDSTEAMICSFECTFCSSCVSELLCDVCPNCGGGFERRPIRPKHEWVKGVSLATRPAQVEHRHRPVDLAKHAELVARVGARPAPGR